MTYRPSLPSRVGGAIRLYIILFLHQTTTPTAQVNNLAALYIILFLHQTTTKSWSYYFKICCISSFSYIKPQLRTIPHRFLHVVYHPFPTSNHNSQRISAPRLSLYIILFLHQTTTSPETDRYLQRCISSFSYIKPQP